MAEDRDSPPDRITQGWTPRNLAFFVVVVPLYLAGLYFVVDLVFRYDQVYGEPSYHRGD